MGWNTGGGGGGGAAKLGSTVYRSTDQSGASAAISFDTVVDNDGLWAVGQPTRMTAQNAGWHTASATIEYKGLGTSLIQAALRHYDAFGVLQGVIWCWGGQLYTGGGSPNYGLMTFGAQFKLDVGEYVELWNDGSTVEGSTAYLTVVEA